jgi:hypothetical protein
MLFAGVSSHSASPPTTPDVPSQRDPVESPSPAVVRSHERPRWSHGSHAPHSDVAAFALGVIDAEDVAHFAGHLEWCLRCQGELDDWLGMRAQLAGLGPETGFADDLLTVEAVHRDGALLERLLAASTRRRRTLRSVRLASLGGSVLLFVAVVVASFGTDLLRSLGSLVPFW